MEIMQLQPVRANLIYPNRINKEDSHVQIVEPMEIINTGIMSTNPVLRQIWWYFFYCE